MTILSLLLSIVMMMLAGTGTIMMTAFQAPSSCFAAAAGDAAGAETTPATPAPAFLLTTSPSSNNSAASSLQHAPQPQQLLPVVDMPSGTIDDAVSCQMEDLDQANESQLYEILQELKRTPFFRNFVVDLQHKCPLASWSSRSHTAAASTTTTNTATPKTTTEATTSSNGNTAFLHLSDSNLEFECSGGEVGEDLDEEAEPLCTVQGGDPFSVAPTTSSATPSTTTSSIFDSNALHHLQSTGFQSQSQQDAFAWQDVTDAVFTEDANKNNKNSKNAFISESALLPDTFWKDMCSWIGSGDGSATVNLALNPERNTGYNGTHIWRAIYEENCIVDTLAAAGSDAEYKDMCLEERVLYRLLSGLHTSTTVSIAMNYYPPSKKKGRTAWEPNPTYFMQKFETNPDHIRNLHFSYVVLLRALGKASPFLYQYQYNSSSGATNGSNDSNNNNDQEDETAAKLIRRLLDSSILQSCSSVFEAFDESLMFQEDLIAATTATTGTTAPAVDVASLKQNFKGVFHNVSSILDCVQCQQCKLHGKLGMLGYGAALKVLFMKEPVLERNEIVALINTIVKLSESVKHVRELTTLYWRELPIVGVAQSLTTTVTSTISLACTDTSGGNSALLTSLDLVDSAVCVVAFLGRNNRITAERELELAQLALQRHPELLILTKHYGSDLEKFLQLSSTIGATAVAAAAHQVADATPAVLDAIVVGSGLAGMAATLNLLDRGGRVIMIEKEHLLGGNSNKASSGINACCPDENTTDSLEIFLKDTLRSAGSLAREDLITTLVSKSAEAVEWLRTRVGVDLSLTAQLGGHSSKRTHRPSNGMAGAEIIYGMQKAVKAYIKTGEVTILTDTKVTKLLTDGDGSVIGVECVHANDKDATPFELHARNVVLATGGFAADRSYGSYLDKYRPELLKMPTTAGTFSTGDGITLATQLGAATVDMDKVQVHPTGWVDPIDPDNTSKILAAELMRGVGGLLINSNGERFCNELGTRSYVTNKMLAHDEGFAKTGNWSIDAMVPIFSLVLSSSAAVDAKKHVDLYTHKGILTRLEGVGTLAKWMGLPKSTVLSTLKEYQKEATRGKDKFGKTTFGGVPAKDLDSEVFYAGKVTPVLHYCMGGITIDVEGNVLNGDGEIIPGLHAAGEVSGGVHGVNRLGGNSLLECTVYGTIVGKKIPIQTKSVTAQPAQAAIDESVKVAAKTRNIVEAELLQHNTPDDCWVAIHGVVYDLTDFADEHPSGPQTIHELAGKDGTEAFAAVHNQGMLEDFDDEIVGVYTA